MAISLKEQPTRTESLVTCPMCGYRYDPKEHTGCASCPLNRGCQLVCCPNCGFETVDPERSVLARFARRHLLRKTSTANTEPRKEERT